MIDEIAESLPNKYETVTECCFNVGPASETASQH